MNGYPPSPSHSTVPPHHSPPTAFTGAGLDVAGIVLVLLLIAALLFGYLSRAFGSDR